MKTMFTALALGAALITPTWAEPSAQWINPAQLQVVLDEQASEEKTAKAEEGSPAEVSQPVAPVDGASSNWVSPAVLNPDAVKKDEAAPENTPQEDTQAFAAASSNSGWISPAVLNAGRTGDADEPETTGSVTKQGKPAAGSSYKALVDKYAREHGVPVAWARAVVHVESRYNPRATGRAGEIGLMQIKLRTARGMGYTGSAKALYNPETNIKYGMLYLAKAYQLAGGDLCGTILRYNAGHYAKRMSAGPRRYCGKVRGLIGA